MRYIALFLLITGCALASETLVIPQGAMPRASDEVKLMELLKQDVENTANHKIDLRLRQRISKLSDKIKREQ